MKRHFILLLILLVGGLTACGPGNKKNRSMETETKLKIETSAGDIVVKLYNETPQHRDNFIKLAENGTYEGTLFHRVIKDFMIQAGDPESKNAPKGKMLGSGDVGYTIPAEFVYPKYFHKKGALSAARQGDNVNPKKESSGCQFYIVTGKVYNDSTLLGMERQMNQMREDNVIEVDPDTYGASITSTYKSYSDAAIVVFSRTGAENYDLAMHDAAGHSDPDDHALQLMDNEEKVIRHAKKYFDKVIVIINSSNIMQIPELNEPKTDTNLGVDAILWVGGVGEDGTKAIPYILNGTVNPPVTL